MLVTHKSTAITIIPCNHFVSSILQFTSKFTCLVISQEWTPLDYAAWSGQSACCDVLVAQGGDVHARDNTVSVS